MKNNLFFVVQLKKNNRHNAIAIAVPKNNNLYHYFDSFNKDGCTVEIVHYANTYKKAVLIADSWNKAFESNGNAWTKDEYADQQIIVIKIKKKVSQLPSFSFSITALARSLMY